MAVVVRPLLPEEWSLWRDLRLRALQDSPEAYGRTYEEESRIDEAEWEARGRSFAADSSGASFVVRVDGDPAGIAACRVDPEDASLVGVFAMWVAPEGRRQGAGRALLDQTIAWAKDRGAEQVELSVTEGNDPAQQLYESAGFVDTGRREPLRDGSPLRIIVRRRSLGS